MSEEKGPGSLPGPVPPPPAATGRGRSRRHTAAPGDGGRNWTNRPLTLVIGWVVSCAALTAITFTAVERITGEVSGSQDLLSAQGLKQQVAAQSASFASVSSAATPLLATGPPTGLPPVKTSTSPAAGHSSPVKQASSAASTPSPSVTPPPPSTSPSVTPSVGPTTGTEYVYRCANGKAIGGVVTVKSPTPTPTPTPSTSPSPSSSPSGSTSGAIAGTVTPSVTPSSSPSPTPSPSTGKMVFDVPGGRVVVACSGNSIANANATVSDSSYTLTVKSTTDPAVDVFFTKN